MDTLFQNAIPITDLSDVFTIWEGTCALLSATVLAFVVAWVYRQTHRGFGYSQDFVHTIILMTVVIALIMLIIGSNIARAFSLVGALSIIRFRNAVKETRDVGYVFFALAIGMACGTRFYALAFLATFAIAGLMSSLRYFNLFGRAATGHVVVLWLPADADFEDLVGQCLADNTDEYHLVGVESNPTENLVEVSYSVTVSSTEAAAVLLSQLRSVEQLERVMLFDEGHAIEV